MRHNRRSRFFSLALVASVLTSALLLANDARAECRSSKVKNAARADLTTDPTHADEPLRPRPNGLAEWSIPANPASAPPFAIPVQSSHGIWDGIDAVVSLSVLRKGRTRRVCNGVQVGRGYILTNNHCLDGEEYVVHFGPLRTQGGASIGGIQCDADPKDIDATSDYAILSIPSPPAQYEGMFIDIPSRATMRARVSAQIGAAASGELPVRMVQVINNQGDRRNREFFRTGQRYLNGVPTCRIRYIEEPRDRRCYHKGPKPYGFDHSCVGQEGSSGAPILDSTTPLLLALHAGTINSQAVPAHEQVQRHFCAVPAYLIGESLRSLGVLPDRR